MADSVHFYRNILGLQVTYPDDQVLDDQFWVTLEAAGTSIALHSGRSQTLAGEPPAISFSVENLLETHQSLNKKGANLSPIENPHPGVHLCTTKDPDGHSITINQA